MKLTDTHDWHCGTFSKDVLVIPSICQQKDGTVGFSCHSCGDAQLPRNPWCLSSLHNSCISWRSAYTHDILNGGNHCFLIINCLQSCNKTSTSHTALVGNLTIMTDATLVTILVYKMSRLSEKDGIPKSLNLSLSCTLQHHFSLQAILKMSPPEKNKWGTTMSS